MNRRFFQIFGAALAASVFLSVGAFAQQNTKFSPSDMTFAQKAASGGMLEVQLGKYAVQNASNEQVKQFGQRMVDDHTKLNDQLKALAAKDNITLATALNAKDQAQLDRLESMKGMAFEKAYMRDQVRDHENDIAAFQKEADTGTNPDLKTWSGQALSTLQEHLKLAKQASQSVGAMSKK